ncbi:MAG: hypothetical protein AABY86_10145, partial [Bdellovibrionota bacterium]
MRILRRTHTILFYQALGIWPGLATMFLSSCFYQASAGESPTHHSPEKCFYRPWLELDRQLGKQLCELKTLMFWPKFYLRTLSPQYYEDKVYALADKAQASGVAISEQVDG